MATNNKQIKKSRTILEFVEIGQTFDFTYKNYLSSYSIYSICVDCSLDPNWVMYEWICVG